MTPSARITLDGKDITTRLLGGGANCVLESLTITDEAGVKSDAVELSISDRDGFSAPPVGSDLQVWLGYDPEPAYMGKFRIDEWTKSGPSRVLKVSAKSAELTTDIKGTKTRSFDGKTVQQIVSQIAGEHGLGQSVDSEIGGRQIEHIDQHGESDMAFLTRLANRQGATFKLADGKVLFSKKGSKSNPSGKDKPALTLKPADVTSWSVTASERPAHKSVICYWHDYTKNKRTAAKSGSGSPTFRDKKIYRTQAEAQAAADAKLGELTRGKKAGQIEMPGKPEAFAEGVVTLQGFDPDADGSYFAKTVTHSLSASGYTTSIALETEKSTPDDS